MRYNLFTHAEIFKDISEDFVGGDLTTCNFSKDVDGETEVF